MKYSNELILKVNELYHDLDGKDYDRKYLKAFIKEEYLRWYKFGLRYLEKNPYNVRLLDIGTGTGYVPLTIGKFLKEGDEYICSDISIKILEIFQRKIQNRQYKCKFKTLKLDGKIINLDSNTLDFITLNSVLHHISDFKSLFIEINRLLKTGALLVIGHEPNRNFVANKFLFFNYKFFNLIFDKKRLIATILRKLGISEKINSKLEQKKAKIIEQMNDQLLKTKIIKNPLTPIQIFKIIDIHSPTAAGHHSDRGINFYKILRNNLPNFELEYVETYNHLGKATRINKITLLYNKILKKIFPKKGATFFVIFRKKT